MLFTQPLPMKLFVLSLSPVFAVIPPWLQGPDSGNIYERKDFRYPDYLQYPYPLCESTGFFQHPWNCSWYYRCHNYPDLITGPFFHEEHFECAPGTVFSNVVHMCVRGRWRDGCPRTDNSTGDSLLSLGLKPHPGPLKPPIQPLKTKSAQKQRSVVHFSANARKVSTEPARRILKVPSKSSIFLLGPPENTNDATPDSSIAKRILKVPSKSSILSLRSPENTAYNATSDSSITKRIPKVPSKSSMFLLESPENSYNPATDSSTAVTSGLDNCVNCSSLYANRCNMEEVCPDEPFARKQKLYLCQTASMECECSGPSGTRKKNISICDVGQYYNIRTGTCYPPSDLCPQIV